MLRRSVLLWVAVPKPMLASPITVTASSSQQKKNLPPGPYYVSPKLDGVRCIINRDGIFTRRRQRLHGLEGIKAAVAPAFAEDRTLVLDGELYTTHGAGAFEGLISAVTALRNAPDSAKSRRLPKAVSQKISFHCFDVIRMNANTKAPQLCNMRGGAKGSVSNGPPVVLPEKTPFYARLRALAHLKRQLQSTDQGSPKVKFVPHLPAKRVADARQHTKTFLSAGFEGSVLRCFDSVYETGKRSKKMIKIVPWIDSEFRVLRFIKGVSATAAKQKGKDGRAQQAKLINSVELMTADGVIFRAHVGVPASVAKQWLAMAKSSDKLTGVFATVRYPRVTSRGVPRFGVVKAIRGKSKRWFL
jgi:hypothetical protein